MAATIKSAIKRQIRLYKVSQPINVLITNHGVSMAVAGAKQYVTASWDEIAEHTRTPEDVPSFLFGQPIALLQKQAEKRGKKAHKKEDP